MNKSWIGPGVTGLIVLGVVGVLLLNLEPGKVSRPSPEKSTAPQADSNPKPVTQAIPERPIGDEVIQNHIRVNAVYASGVTMDGMAASPSGSDLIHLEADVKSTEDNPNGFAKDEFVPYLKITYSIVPASGRTAVAEGELFPMVASDGLHYGANIDRPRPGDYRLIYNIQPPAMGRHVGAVGGVAAWWAPFQARFDWTVEPLAPPTTVAGSN